MRHLIQGGESTERLELLLSLTSITSNDAKDALMEHLVRGIGAASAAALNGMTQSNFSRALKTVELVAATVERIKEIDWRHLKSDK
jgi:hypothetical protein